MRQLRSRRCSSGLVLDLLEEAGLQQLLAVDREERVDAVADDAHDLAVAPRRVAHDIALLERAEHGPLDPLDLERAAATATTSTERFLEECFARVRIGTAAS